MEEVREYFNFLLRMIEEDYERIVDKKQWLLNCLTVQHMSISIREIEQNRSLSIPRQNMIRKRKRESFIYHMNL